MYGGRTCRSEVRYQTTETDKANNGQSWLDQAVILLFRIMCAHPSPNPSATQSPLLGILAFSRDNCESVAIWPVRVQADYTYACNSHTVTVQRSLVQKSSLLCAEADRSALFAPLQWSVRLAATSRRNHTNERTLCRFLSDN